MSIKRNQKTLSERIGLVASTPEVTIHVPDDTAAEMVKGAAAVAATVQGLVDERTDLQRKNEMLMREVVFLRHTVANVDKERDYWRKQATIYIRANGELAAIYASMLKFAESANGTIQHSQAMADLMPAPERAHVMPAYDKDGVPIDNEQTPPTISLGELNILTNEKG
jgi:hypothetical protein